MVNSAAQRRAAPRPPLAQHHRQIHPIAQEARRRDVPSIPEIGDAERLVGREKILRQQDTEHARQADRHIGVAGEIEIKLHRDVEGRQPRLDRRQTQPGGGSAEQTVDVDCERVGDQDLLRQAEAEDGDADGKIRGIETPEIFLIQLRNDFARMHHRTRDRDREKTAEHRVAQKIAIAIHPARAIRQVANLLEGEK